MRIFGPLRWEATYLETQNSPDLSQRFGSLFWTDQYWYLLPAAFISHIFFQEQTLSPPFPTSTTHGTVVIGYEHMQLRIDAMESDILSSVNTLKLGAKFRALSISTQNV